MGVGEVRAVLAEDERLEEIRKVLQQRANLLRLIRMALGILL